MSKNKKSNKKIQNILIFAGFSAVILIVSTYAWFIGLQEVTVSEFQIEIASTDNLLISLNGVEWGESITINEGAWDAYNATTPTPSQVYDDHNNSWGNGLMPISTVGDVDLASSTLKLFERGGYDHTGGGFRLIADRLENNGATVDHASSDEVDGYVAFDLFVRNFTGAQYISTYNPDDEEEIFLLTDETSVEVDVAGSASTTDEALRNASGIENSVRVAFAQIGRVAGTSEDMTEIGAISCSNTIGGVEGTVTGICEDAVIYEPNERDHEQVAIDWFTTYCDQRTDATTYTNDTCQVSNTVPGTPDPVQTFAAFADDMEIDTWAVSDEIVSATAFDIYDGHNTFVPTATVENVETFTDAEKLMTGNDRPVFMTLAPNSITKIRVYVYLEGNDLDNMDLSAIGQAINVSFGFTKQRFEQTDFQP